MFQRRHPSALEEFEQLRLSRPKKRCRDGDSAGEAASLTGRNAPKRTTQCTFTLGAKRDDGQKLSQEEFTKKLTAFIVDGMYPLSIVENEKFIDLFSG